MILRNAREAETEGSNIELLSWQEFFSTSLRSPCSYSAEWTEPQGVQSQCIAGIFPQVLASTNGPKA